MRCVFYILICTLTCCAPYGPRMGEKILCDYKSLAEVVADFTRASGKSLCAELYSYSGHGMYGFYDSKILNKSQAFEQNALLLGEEDVSAHLKRSYPRNGQRVFIRGTLNLQTSCFTRPEDTCIPVKHPIYLNSSDITISVK